MELVAIAGHDAGGFLTTVLQGVQAKRGVGGGGGVIKDTKDATLFAGFIVIILVGQAKRMDREVNHRSLGFLLG
jgi:hypothetical protein